MIHGNLALQSPSSLPSSTESFAAFLMTEPVPPSIVPLQMRPRAGTILHGHLREQLPERDGNAGHDEARFVQAASRA